MPACTKPECPASACETDTAKLELSTKWKGLKLSRKFNKLHNSNRAANDDGVFRSACGKQYFVSKVSKNKAQAETECCKYGLKLLSIESYEEIECLADMNAGSEKFKNQFKLCELKIFFSGAATLKQVDRMYWTSGSSEGHGCVKNYGWCSSGKMFSGVAANYSNWNGGKPGNPYEEHCVQLKLDSNPKKMLFDDLSCAENILFICEVSI
jgi:hypothetical protein